MIKYKELKYIFKKKKPSIFTFGFNLGKLVCSIRWCSLVGEPGSNDKLRIEKCINKPNRPYYHYLYLPLIGKYFLLCGYGITI